MSFYLKIAVFFALLSVLSFKTGYQGKIKEGIIYYNIKNDEGIIPASYFAIYFTEKKSKIELNYHGGKYIMRLITLNGKPEKNIMLLTLMDEKIVVKNFPKDSFGILNNFDQRSLVKYNKKIKKNIAHYSCSQAIYLSDNSEPVIFYITKKIAPEFSYFSWAFPDIKGFPLEFSFSNHGEKKTFTAKKVIPKVPEKYFHIPPDYKEISYEQFREIMGGLRFGF